VYSTPTPGREKKKGKWGKKKVHLLKRGKSRRFGVTATKKRRKGGGKTDFASSALQREERFRSPAFEGGKVVSPWELLDAKEEGNKKKNVAYIRKRKKGKRKRPKKPGGQQKKNGDEEKRDMSLVEKTKKRN